MWKTKIFRPPAKCSVHSTSYTDHLDWSAKLSTSLSLKLWLVCIFEDWPFWFVYCLWFGSPTKPYFLFFYLCLCGLSLLRNDSTRVKSIVTLFPLFNRNKYSALIKQFNHFTNFNGNFTTLLIKLVSNFLPARPTMYNAKIIIKLD